MRPHTPAPWHVARDTYGVERIWGPDGESVASTEGDGFIDDDERDGNTRLIAAAPVLLAACKAAEEHFHDFHPGRSFVVCGLIQAAIAKAEGQS